LATSSLLSHDVLEQPLRPHAGVLPVQRADAARLQPNGIESTTSGQRNQRHIGEVSPELAAKWRARLARVAIMAA